MQAPAYHDLLPRAERAGIYHMPFAADLALEEAAESLDYPLHRVDLARVAKIGRVSKPYIRSVSKLR